MTNNAIDYIRLFNESLAAGQEHFGLLLTDNRSMPRSRKTIGLFVRTLEAFLSQHPAEDALGNQLHWLP